MKKISILWIALSLWACDTKHTSTLDVNIDCGRAKEFLYKMDTLDVDFSECSGRIYGMSLTSKYLITGDYGVGSLLIYDLEGNYLFSKLREGRGPNEVDHMMQYCISDHCGYVFGNNGYQLYTLDADFNIVKQQTVKLDSKHHHKELDGVEDIEKSCPACPQFFLPMWGTSSKIFLCQDSLIVNAGFKRTKSFLCDEDQYAAGILNGNTAMKESLALKMPHKAYSPTDHREAYSRHDMSYFGNHFFTWEFIDEVINEYDTDFQLVKRYHCGADPKYPLTPYVKPITKPWESETGTMESSGVYKEVCDIPEKHLLCRVYNTSFDEKREILQVIDTESEMLQCSTPLPHKVKILGYKKGMLYLAEDIDEMGIDMHLSIYRVYL